MNKRFQWKPFLSAVCAIAIPVALQNLLTNTGSIVDTMMIASLGEQSVAAVGLCEQFSILVFSCYWGFVSGGMMFISQYFGANDEAGMERSYGLMTAVCLFVAITASVLAVCFPHAVMSIYTDKPAIQAIGEDYVRIVGFAFPFNVLAVCSAGLLRATGHAKYPLYSSVMAVIVNVCLNYVLIYGRFGLPALGVKGAAIATVVSGVINFLSNHIFAKVHRIRYLFAFSAFFRWTKDFVRYFMKKIFPILCNEVMIGVSGSLISIIFGRQQEEAIAAFAVISVLEGIYLAFFSGYSNAAGIMIGNSVGAGRLKEAYSYAPRFVILCALIIAAIDVPILIFRVPLLSALGLSGTSLRIGEGILWIFAGIFIIRMNNWLLNDMFRAGGDSVYGTVCELTFMYLFVLPLLYVSAFVWALPFILLFAVRYSDELIRIFMMLFHMRSGKWIKPVTPEGRAAVPAFMKEIGRMRAEKAPSKM